MKVLLISSSDHPNARQQKRRPIETGPFGKSTRRRGSSRGTRTATPAKKEPSAIDGWTRGLEEDKRKAALYQELHDEPTDRLTVQQDNLATSTREPVSAVLYGYSPSTQWAAIAHYEKASGGMICEDYERQPPLEGRKYPNTFSSPNIGTRRQLTATERKLSMHYRGGDCWIKVTFDSTEAADRAFHFSPQLIQGYWVYAEPFMEGIIPNNDKPMALLPEDTGGASTPRPTRLPSHKTTQSLGPSASRNFFAQSSATLPRSFAPNSAVPTTPQQQADSDSHSPSTASSATATGHNEASLRRGQSELQQSRPQNGSYDVLQTPQQTSRYMKHFPDTPRTILRPANEAFLPHPSWIQRRKNWATELGLIPSGFVGHSVPRTESGEFDGANANLYWKFCNFIDHYLKTDLCGLREE